MSVHQPQRPDCEQEYDATSPDLSSEQQSFLPPIRIDSIVSSECRPRCTMSKHAIAETQSEQLRKLSHDDTPNSLQDGELNSGKTFDTDVTPLRPLDGVIHERGESSQAPGWKPLWLRPSITGSFAVVFVIVAVALIIMTLWSRKNDGLDDANDRLVYLWRFGPTAFFTVIAILWGRVELQACRYTPWLTTQDKGRSRRKTTSDLSSLDYTEMLLPAVLSRSLRNGHFLVFASTITTILLKVQIILSSSIFYANLVSRAENINVNIQDSFSKVTDTRYRDNWVDPAGYFDALLTYDVPVPFGLWLNGSYQRYSIGDDGNQTSSGLNFGETLNITVDSVSAGAECLHMSNWTMSKNLTGEANAEGRHILDFRFNECDSSIRIPIQFRKEHQGMQYHFQGLDRDMTGCAELPPNQQFFYAWANFTTDEANNHTEPQLHSCTAVLCSSSISVSPIQVVDRVVVQQLVGHPTAVGELIFDVDPWDLMMQFSAWDRFLNNDLASFSDGNIFTNQSIDREILFEVDREPGWTEERYMEAQIQILVTEFIAIVTHFMMRKNDFTETTGTRSFNVARLRIQPGVTISMAFISTCCAVFALYATWKSQRVTKRFSRDPATIVGSMLVLVKKEGEVRQTPDTLRGCHAGACKASWIKAATSPLILSFKIRTALVSYILVLIVALSATLRVSQDHNGLAHFDDDNNYAPLAWQLLPTTALILVSLYSTSSDFAIRNLALLADLSHRSRSSPEIDISLLDTLGGKALFRSFRLGIPAVAVSQSLATLCGFLPILGSMLLIPQATPEVVKTDFPEYSWFGTILENETMPPNSGDRMRKLFLVYDLANFASAPNTYADLMFPSILTRDMDWGEGDSIQVTLPAATIADWCYPVSEQHYRISNRTIASQPGFDVLVPTLHRTFTCPNGTESSIDLVLGSILSGAGRDDKYLGTSMPSPATPQVGHGHCSSEGFDSGEISPWLVQTYAWGVVPYPYESFGNLSVWECNYTWIEVEADVNYYWDIEAVVNQTVPPTLRNTGDPVDGFDYPRGVDYPLYTPAFTVPMMEPDPLVQVIQISQLTNNATQAFTEVGLDDHFSRIVEPYGPIQLQYLGDASRDREVTGALGSLFAFAAAQVASGYQRLSYGEESDLFPFERPIKDMRKFKGYISHHRRQTIVQEADITYATIIILSIVALVHTWALISELWRRRFRITKENPWLLDLELKGVAPPSCNSLILVESILEGSNYDRILPENAHLMQPEELHKHLQGNRFQLGWFHNLETGEDVYTIGVLNEGGLVYKGSLPAIDSGEWRSVGEAPGLMLDILNRK